jgi:hypothetical protein
MIGLRGKFGLVLRSVRCVSHRTILLDVLLDHAGVPDGIDPAWQAKHYLGAPVPGATIATVNLAHVVAAADLPAEVTVERPGDGSVLTRAKIRPI